MAEPFRYPTPAVTQMVASSVAMKGFTEGQMAEVFDIAYRAAGIGHVDGWRAAIDKADARRHARDQQNGRKP